MARILCGRTDVARHYHDSVSEVRTCQEVKRGPTEAMLRYVTGLKGDAAKASRMSFEECSSYIDNLKRGVTGLGGMTVVSGKMTGSAGLCMPPVLIKDIPEGYYAILRESGEGFKFWRVGVRTAGEGDSAFVERWVLQSVPKRTQSEPLKLHEVLLIAVRSGSDLVSMVGSRTDEINAALKAILLRGDELKVQYGKEEGFCGECGRELTDPQSLAIGIGPECAKNNPHLFEE